MIRIPFVRIGWGPIDFNWFLVLLWETIQNQFDSTRIGRKLYGLAQLDWFCWLISFFSFSPLQSNKEKRVHLCQTHLIRNQWLIPLPMWFAVVSLLPLNRYLKQIVLWGNLNWSVEDNFPQYDDSRKCMLLPICSSGISNKWLWLRYLILWMKWVVIYYQYLL